MRRGRRLLYALTPAVLVLLVAVSPAVPRLDRTRYVPHLGQAGIAAVDSSLASLSAGVTERVPVPGVWPMQAPSVGGIAGLTWLVIVVAVAFAIGCIGLTRRERAPPRFLLSASS